MKINEEMSKHDTLLDIFKERLTETNRNAVNIAIEKIESEVMDMGFRHFIRIYCPHFSDEILIHGEAIGVSNDGGPSIAASKFLIVSSNGEIKKTPLVTASSSREEVYNYRQYAAIFTSRTGLNVFELTDILTPL